MASLKVPGKNRQSITTSVALHPGEVIAMEIIARGIRKADIAAQLNIKPSQFSELLDGLRSVNAPLALQLESVLGIDADFWLHLQSAYDLAIKRQKLKTLPV